MQISYSWPKSTSHVATEYPFGSEQNVSENPASHELSPSTAIDGYLSEMEVVQLTPSAVPVADLFRATFVDDPHGYTCTSLRTTAYPGLDVI